MGFQGVQQMSANGHQRIQPGHRVLKHEASGLSAQPTQGGTIQCPRIDARQLQRPFALGPWGQQLHHGTGHSAFAAARGTHQGHGFSGRQG